MSATVALSGPTRYKDRVKLMRAETVSAWAVAAFSWVKEAPKSQTGTPEQEQAAEVRRWYGAFY